MNLSKEEVGNLVGSFTWLWGMTFHIDCGDIQLIWKDPDYGGDNTIVPTTMNSTQYAREVLNVPHGRCKSVHRIADYCGPNFTLPQAVK